ncbi:MAG: hypothetical protein LBR08_01805 [Bacteroidales bacterium]|jgi:cell fate regulator YaaT (PSP1 superfamily)|nr:hypothetical protein [Bacteroidales bacterium]
MNDPYITRGCFHLPSENPEEDTCRRRHYCCGRNKLDVYNWLEDIPGEATVRNMVEVRFKNTRKGYYINQDNLPLTKGDVVAVEASPGHDVGVVSLIGSVALFQMRRKGISTGGLKKIYRKARTGDIEKWYQAIEKEQETMQTARRIAFDMRFPMKISDAEYQGDKTRVTFYYLSEERIDFRQLIKEYADHFKVRIEMKQIGSRQEAGKVGGIGTCGRELCCTKWMASFVSVSTNAARYQEVTLNPQKLAGQCGKLKCCLNFEMKCYADMLQDFPNVAVPLETERGKIYHTKTDIFRRIIWYTFDRGNEEAALIPLDVDAVKKIMELNRQGIKAKELTVNEREPDKKTDENYRNAVGEDSISRFEEKRRKKKKKSGRGKGRPEGGAAGEQQAAPRQEVAAAEKQPQPKPSAQAEEAKTKSRNSRRRRSRGGRGGRGGDSKPANQ